MSSMRDETTERMQLERRVLAALRMLSDDKPPATQMMGVDWILSIGPSAIPVLMDALPDLAAADALRFLGEPAIYALLALSRDANATPEDQRNALYALVDFARRNADARAFYEIRRLESEGLTEEVRVFSQYAMYRFDRSLGKHMERLSKAVDELATDNPRKLNVRAGKLARQAEREPSVLSMLLYKAPDEQLTGGITVVMLKIGEPVVSRTIEAFDAGVRGLAWPLAALGKSFPEAQSAVQQAAESHPDAGIRTEAEQALELMSQYDATHHS